MKDIDVFISHHTKSSLKITEAISKCLESDSIKCWYAPRDTEGAYAHDIPTAIDSCRVFILVLNQEASESVDVLNEINLSVERIRNNEEIYIIPFRISEDDVSKDAKYYIGRLHWIDAFTPPLESRISELKSFIKKILAGEKTEFIKNSISGLKSSCILPNYNFIGREDELQSIEKHLTTDRVVFLYGMGGLGKTEIAKTYARYATKKYDTIIIANYESNLQNLIISNKFFNFGDFPRNAVDGIPESDYEYAIRKLSRIKELSSERTLIIIDNFSTTEDVLLNDFLSGTYHIIFTTRINFEYTGMPVISVEELDKPTTYNLFKNYYKLNCDSEDEIAIHKIIEQVNMHTLAIELISKLMAKKRIKPKDMLLKLSNEGITPHIGGSISRGLEFAKTMYSHILALFNIETLSDNEKSIMMNLSLLPSSGVIVDDFLKWCEIDDYEHVDNLIRNSWIQYNFNKDTICLHPVISDVIKTEFAVDLDSCKTMCHNIAETFKSSWSISPEKRTEFGEIAKSLYRNNKNKNKSFFSIYQSFIYVFSNLDYWDLCDEVFATMKEMLGDNPCLELGRYYLQLADIQLRYMNYEKAVEFLKESINVIRIVSPSSNELAYVLKHLAHTYHAMYKLIKKSGHYLDKALVCLTECETIYNKSDCKQLSDIGSLNYAYALNFYYSQKYSESLVYAQLSMEIFLDLNGEIHSDTAAPMRVIAMIYSKTGRFNEAIEMQNRVIEAKKQLWNKNQYNYFKEYETLADIYYNNGDIATSIKFLNYIIELLGENANHYKKYETYIFKKINEYSKS